MWQGSYLEKAEEPPVFEALEVHDLLLQEVVHAWPHIITHATRRACEATENGESHMRVVTSGPSVHDATSDDHHKHNMQRTFGIRTEEGEEPRDEEAELGATRELGVQACKQAQARLYKQQTGAGEHSDPLMGKAIRRHVYEGWVI
jgi:hypothetical protein